MPRRPKDQPTPPPTAKQIERSSTRPMGTPKVYERFELLNELRHQLGLPLYNTPEEVPYHQLLAPNIDKLMERVNYADAQALMAQKPVPRLTRGRTPKPNPTHIDLHFRISQSSLDHLRQLLLPYAKIAVQQDSEHQIAGLLASNDRDDSTQTRIAYLRNQRHRFIGSSHKISGYTGRVLPERIPVPHRKIGQGLLIYTQHLLTRQEPAGPQDTRPEEIKGEDIDRLLWQQANPSGPWRGPQWTPANDPDDPDPRSVHSTVISQETYNNLLRIGYLLHVVNSKGTLSDDSRVRTTLEAIALGWIS